MADWYSVDTSEAENRLRSAWPDAPVENTEICGHLLEVAKEQVLEYAPDPDPDALTVVDGVLVAGEPTPARYVMAQLRQAQNLWRAGEASSDGNVGPEGFTFIPRPMDRTIKQIIRPQSGKPHVL